MALHTVSEAKMVGCSGVPGEFPLPTIHVVLAFPFLNDTGSYHQV